MLATQIFTRHFRTALRQCARPKKVKANAGVAMHVKQLQKEHPGQEPFADIEPGEDFDYAEHESDFFNVHKTHKQLEREMEDRRELVRLRIVQRKYFAQKLPNFLTYGEKEHIRLLHERDAKEWSVERLAESFPATEEVITKILKANWRPYSLKHLKRHDEAALRNWELLREGGHTDLPEELRQHLLKFSKRERSVAAGQLYEEFVKRPQLPQPKRQEFLQLVSMTTNQPDEEKRADELKEKSKKQTENKFREAIEATATNIKPQEAEEETYLLQKVRDKRHITLEQLKGTQHKQLQIEGAQEQEQTSSQHAAVDIKKEKWPADIRSEQFPAAYESKEIVIGAEDCQKFEISTAKDRIYIPKNLWREGATYKVDDSYYDDDGEFLYSVPGMTGLKK